MKNKGFILYTILLAGIMILWNSCEDYTEDFSPAPASLNVEFSYTPEKFISPSREITFVNSSVVPVRMGNPTFTWNFGDGTVKEVPDATIQNETDLIQQYYSEITHTYSDTGQYTVSLRVTTESGDTSVFSEDILVEYALIGDTLLVETFDDISLMPSDWVLRNLDGATPALEGDAAFADSAWAVRYSGSFDSKVAVGVSYYEPEQGANDWMILKKIELGDSTAMRWDAMSFTSSGNYPDDYGIYVSTTDQTVAGCEAHGLLLKVDDESWAADIAGGKGIQSRRFYFYEHGFRNQEVYVAFRLMTPHPGGSSLGIDNITIVELSE
jgi:hypothetical protein